MSFSLLHLIAIFCIGFFLGCIFGLGLYYLRPQKKNVTQTTAPTNFDQLNDPNFDPPNTLILDRSQPSSQPIILEQPDIPLSQQKTEHLEMAVVDNDERTQDIQSIIDPETLAEQFSDFEDDNDDDDATLVKKRT